MIKKLIELLIQVRPSYCDQCLPTFGLASFERIITKHTLIFLFFLDLNNIWFCEKDVLPKKEVEKNFKQIEKKVASERLYTIEQLERQAMSKKLSFWESESEI